MESYGLLGEFTGAGDSGAGSRTRTGPHYSKLVSLSSCCFCSKSRHLEGGAGDVPLDALLLLSSDINDEAGDGMLLIDPLPRQVGSSALTFSQVCFFVKCFVILFC
jgi:hypothetical protein